MIEFLIALVVIAVLFATVITAPNSAYTGTSATVPFVDGKGETDNPALIEWFRNNGYGVGSDEPITPPFPQGDAADRRLNPDAPEVLPPDSPASWNGMPYRPQMSSPGETQIEGSAPNGQTAAMTEDPLAQAQNIVAIANGEEPTTPVGDTEESAKKPRQSRTKKTDAEGETTSSAPNGGETE